MNSFGERAALSKKHQHYKKNKLEEKINPGDQAIVDNFLDTPNSAIMFSGSNISMTVCICSKDFSCSRGEFCHRAFFICIGGDKVLEAIEILKKDNAIIFNDTVNHATPYVEMLELETDLKHVNQIDRSDEHDYIFNRLKQIKFSILSDAIGRYTEETDALPKKAYKLITEIKNLLNQDPAKKLNVEDFKSFYESAIKLLNTNVNSNLGLFFNIRSADTNEQCKAYYNSINIPFKNALPYFDKKIIRPGLREGS